MLARVGAVCLDGVKRDWGACGSRKALITILCSLSLMVDMYIYVPRVELTPESLIEIFPFRVPYSELTSSRFSVFGTLAFRLWNSWKGFRDFHLLDCTGRSPVF
jgi:hypothetical protein